MATDSPSVVALVPMKPVAQAKSRLLEKVDPILREAAVLLMLHTVVRAAVEAIGSGACTVIGGDPLARRIVCEAGGDWRQETGTDLNSSLWAAMQESYREGWKAVLFLPSDLPAATAEDVRAVVVASKGLTMPVGVAAGRDGGTNALLVPSSCAFQPELGLSSFARHQQAALRRGTALQQVESPGLSFDVDSPDDLEWAREHVGGFEAALRRWRHRLL